MAKDTKIEWAHHTFNPWIGCTKVSPACDHCYAERGMAARFQGVKWGAGQPRKRTGERNWNDPKRWNAEAERLGIRYRVFCASLADVFDNEVPPAWRAELFALISMTPHLDWLLLTKRIGNVQKMIEAPGMDKRGLATNVWLGATICNQAEADRDIPKLLAKPAERRFLSIEPLLGAVDISEHLWGRAQPCAVCRKDIDCLCGWEPRAAINGEPALHWVIVGGESGPHARPMHPDWVRSLRDQCSTAGVPFLFKQWGEWVPRGPESWGYPLVDGVPRIRLTDRGENGSDLAASGGNEVWMQRAGKHRAGRQLDGRTWDEVPA